MTGPAWSGVVRLQRHLPVAPEEVFAAWTDPESLKQWFCPGTTTVPEATLDLRVGGCFRIVMRTRQGEEVEHTGEYREIRPARRLVFTWRSPHTGSEDTLVTVEFHPTARGTELVLTHERLPDAAAGEKHRSGWDSILAKLEEHLQGARP